MRAIVQRVLRAAVSVDGPEVGRIGPGLVILLGVGPDDTEAVAAHFATRIATLRIHADDAGRMNRDLVATGGEALVVSQFTLFADTARGHRPAFTAAGPPALAESLCDHFVDALRGRGVTVATGRFAAHMEVDLVNDGPVTLALSSADPGWATDAG